MSTVETVERALCKIFAEVLELDELGLDDGFFDVGGDSVLAVQVVSRACAAGLALSVRDIFDRQTVAGLAEVVTAATRPTLRPAPRPDRAPLSPAQRRLYFLNRLQGPSSTYNIAGALRLSGELDRAALDDALADVVARHETLRTVFPDAEGEPWQRVLGTAAARPALSVVDCPTGDIATALKAAAGHPFDLTAGDLPLRATLFAVAPREHALGVTVHHIAGDGWSIAPLMRDLGTAYTARIAGQSPGWDPLPVQYIDYTLWQRDLFDGTDLLATQLAFWEKELAGAPDTLRLPTDRPRPGIPSFRGDNVLFPIPAKLHTRLADLAHTNGATLFMVLHTALAALLTRLGAGTDIPIGSPIAGRTDQALDDLVGFFVNTLVLRTDCAGTPSFRDLLGRVRDTTLGAYTHQDLPFERLVTELAPTRNLSRNPLVQVVFQLQNTEAAPPRFGDARVSRFDDGFVNTRFDTEVHLQEVDGGLAGRWICAADIYDEASIERFIASYIQLLEHISRAWSADPRF